MIKMNLLNKFLRTFEIYRLRNHKSIQGWLTDYEAWALFHYSRSIKDGGVIVEIGSWMGKSTYCLAKGISSSSKIIAIDPFNADGEKESIATYKRFMENKSLYEIFIHNMKERKVIDKIEPKIGYSKDFANQISEIDLLFIDGDHSIQGCIDDFTNYSKKLIKGGIIAFHDFRPEQTGLGPVYVVNNLINNNDFEFLGLYNSLWVAKRI